MQMWSYTRWVIVVDYLICMLSCIFKGLQTIDNTIIDTSQYQYMQAAGDEMLFFSNQFVNNHSVGNDITVPDKDEWCL